MYIYRVLQLRLIGTVSQEGLGKKAQAVRNSLCISLGLFLVLVLRNRHAVRKPKLFATVSASALGCFWFWCFGIDMYTHPQNMMHAHRLHSSVLYPPEYREVIFQWFLDCAPFGHCHSCHITVRPGTCIHLLFGHGYTSKATRFPVQETQLLSPKISTHPETSLDLFSIAHSLP